MSEWHQEAKRLRAEGWTLGQLAARYGVTRQGVRYATDPTVRERENARHLHRYRYDAAYRETKRQSVRDAKAKRTAHD